MAASKNMCAHTLQELKLQRIKIAMVLSSLGIHRLHVSRTTLVFFWQGGSWLYSSVIERWTCNRACSRLCDMEFAGLNLNQRALISQ